jgi:hypothetical protein
LNAFAENLYSGIAPAANLKQLFWFFSRFDLSSTQTVTGAAIEPSSFLFRAHCDFHDGSLGDNKHQHFDASKAELRRDNDLAAARLEWRS